MNRNRIPLPCLVIALLVLAGIPPQGHAAGVANGCHCFRDRTFKPEQKFASDDYLLTTTFNSLLASEFTVTKRQIIMMKMREGVANEDLVTALYLATKSAREFSDLLALKKKYTWKRIIQQLPGGKTSADADDDLFQFIATGATDAEIAEHITNEIIIKRFAPAPESLELLRKKGFQSREIILIYSLAPHTGTSVEKLIDQYRNRGMSWSEIAHESGMEPADVGKMLESGTKNSQ